MSSIDQVCIHILMCVHVKSGRYFENLLYNNYSITLCRIKAPALIDLVFRKDYFYILKTMRGKNIT